MLGGRDQVALLAMSPVDVGHGSPFLSSSPIRKVAVCARATTLV